MPWLLSKSIPKYFQWPSFWWGVLFAVHQGQVLDQSLHSTRWQHYQWLFISIQTGFQHMDRKFRNFRWMTTMYLCICVCLCLQYCFSSLAIPLTMHYFMRSGGFILQINRFTSFMMDRAGEDSNPAHWSALENVKKGINCVFLTFTFINFMALPNNKSPSYYTEIIK